MPKLHLTTVRDTIVTCTTCRGSARVAIDKGFGVKEIRLCPACNGTRETYIGYDNLSQRGDK